MKYKFKREDTGEIISVPWSVMIDQIGGYITLSDGVQARRCVYLEEHDSPFRKRVNKLRTAIVSDAAGFPQHQFEEFEADRKANGHTGIEFRRDPQTPEFFQVHCSSQKEFDRYIRHRGMSNHSGKGGAQLSPGLMRQAEEFARRVHS